MKVEEFQFVAHPDKPEVSAVIFRPRGAKSLVVLGHGAGAGMQHPNMVSIAETLAANKVATMRYQFPFMERGGGRDSVKVSLSTVSNALKVAKKKVSRLKLYSGGHSFGGRMTSLAAAEGMLDRAAGLIFFAFPLHAPGKPGNERAAHLTDIKIPMLFLSGDRDQLLNMSKFKPVLKRLGTRATLHKLETANHSYKILKKTRKNEENIFVEMGRVASQWIADN